VSVHFLAGDVLVNRNKARAIAHGCNTEGVMGAGIAAELRAKYPWMFEAYRRACRDGEFKLGSCLTCESGGDITIFCLATQRLPRGPQPRASLKAVEDALWNMRSEMERLGIESVAMPPIGCGLGGLDWESQVKIAVVNALSSWEGTAYAYTTFARGI
jgi:O-acetyl-ADP-ribose deacetylase (regulator of RNase III)